MNSNVPAGYKSLLSIYDTQKAISLLKRLFEDRLCALLNLYRVSAPLFVEADSGLNDDLNGVERPVSFDILRSDKTAQVVQSLAKWKRMALKRYGFYPGRGLCTDMDAIRRDEDTLDNLHSVYVDQWDWEKVILPENRNIDYLKSTVMDIVAAICDTQETIQAIYPQLQGLGKLERRVSFVTAQQLE
ncbi:MAG: aspartate--ammonia ligase, partial [Oscillospiraceae bacterium]|nr:aspartate--ammonia ligase [Oscillospiraceae bacterium]